MFCVQALHHVLQPRTVRLVIYTLTLFFFYNLTLCFYPNVLDVGMKHSFAFKPQTQFHLVRRQQFKVERTVLRGVGIQCATCISYIAVKFTALDVFTPLKQQVLKEVCKTGTLCVFVFTTNVVKDRNSSNRSAVVFMKNYVQTIV